MSEQERKPSLASGILITFIALFCGFVGFFIGIDYQRAILADQARIEQKAHTVSVSAYLQDMVLYTFKVKYRYKMPTSLRYEGFDRRHGINDSNICIRHLFGQTFSNHTHAELSEGKSVAAKRAAILNELRVQINRGACPGVTIINTEVNWGKT